MKKQFLCDMLNICQWDFSYIYLRMTFYLNVFLLLLWSNDVLWLVWVCDVCIWHHKTFLVQLYWHLGIKLNCTVHCIKCLNGTVRKRVQNSLMGQYERACKMSQWDSTKLCKKESCRNSICCDYRLFKMSVAFKSI